MAAPGPNATVSSELLNPSIHALERLDPEVAAAAIEAGVRILGDAGYGDAISGGMYPLRIQYGTILDVLESSRRISGDPAFGLSGGLGLQRGDLGVLQFVTSTAATLGESILLAARYLPLLNDAARIHLSEIGDAVVIEYRLLRGLPTPASANEYVLSSLLASSEQALGFSAPPREVRFIHARPVYADAYVPVFGENLRFGCEHNTIVVAKGAMDLPLLSSDPPLHLVMRRHADELLRRLPRADAFAQRVRTLIHAQLPDGARLGALAQALHVSESTLQRRLQAAGTSRSEMVDDVRQELAPELLADRTLNVSEVALRLGFAHRPAFHRAFRRWFGLSPREYRANRPRAAMERLMEGLRGEDTQSHSQGTPRHN